MKREIVQWTIDELVERIKPYLGFPEFQREPNVWDIGKKQKLIDSILRGFDIGVIYLYRKDEDNFECIDGRQRINSIYSFLGKNKDIEDSDNDFHIKIENDIYPEIDKVLLDLNDKSYDDLSLKQKEIVDKRVKWYHLNIILLSNENPDEERNEQELSLQFIRLQIASQLNAGEKLHAMSGDMHKFIFKDLFRIDSKGNRVEHPFFSDIKIPYKRYAKEQVAAQIALNYFGLMEKEPTFYRSRYIDLQYFFKSKMQFDENDKNIIDDIRIKLNLIAKEFSDALSLIENRAIAVTTFLFSAQLINNKREKQLPKFKEFLVEFIATLKWQLKLYRNAKQNPEYREIFTDFQNYITQAAGESYAIERRHNFLHKYFEYYLQHEEIIGDMEFSKATGKNPKLERSDKTVLQMKLPEG
jgi:hypothetical protein